MTYGKAVKAVKAVKLREFTVPASVTGSGENGETPFRGFTVHRPVSPPPVSRFCVVVRGF